MATFFVEPISLRLHVVFSGDATKAFLLRYDPVEIKGKMEFLSTLDLLVEMRAVEFHGRMGKAADSSL
jgi:hypothetical protein